MFSTGFYSSPNHLIKWDENCSRIELLSVICKIFLFVILGSWRKLSPSRKVFFFWRFQARNLKIVKSFDCLAFFRGGVCWSCLCLGCSQSDTIQELLDADIQVGQKRNRGSVHISCNHFWGSQENPSQWNTVPKMWDLSLSVLYSQSFFFFKSGLV